MIITEIHQESGFGNQIWCAVVTKIIGIECGYNFGILAKERYKGKDIIDLDFGLPVTSQDIRYEYKERLIRNKQGIDISPLDPNMFRLPDGTKIDGNMQALSYIEPHKKHIVEWLKIKEDQIDLEYSNDNFCVCHLRGGDYIGSPADSLLRIEYYQNAMNYMLDINKDMKFFMVSDDYDLAKSYCDKLGIEFVGSTAKKEEDPYKSNYHKGGTIAKDYSVINNAKNIILSNSTFGFWAAYTNVKLKNIIAPKYWFSHNLDGDYWSTSDMQLEEWKYLDRYGKIW
jgi:hypothetical protein